MSYRFSRGFRVLPPFLGFLVSVLLVGAGPRFEEIGKKKVLHVNGTPFVVLSIEDHNTVDFKGNPREEYFRIVSELNANTISVTFRWNFFEKIPGEYDTTILRNIERMAAKHDLKVVILWFGSNVCGHENCVPNYVRMDSAAYAPYTRGDRTFAAKTSDDGGGRIYCYSFDRDHVNRLLLREQAALKALISWIKNNDTAETFIMLQLGNELSVSPELWRPWPAAILPSAVLLPSEEKFAWREQFHVQACSLGIVVQGEIPEDVALRFALADPTGREYWSSAFTGGQKQKIKIGGPFMNRSFQLAMHKRGATRDTVKMDFARIEPFAERCHCRRCDKIFASGKFLSGQDFQESVFMNYTKYLAGAVAKVMPDFPVYLNVMIGDWFGALLGNPYSSLGTYLDSIGDIDFIGPDIYRESDVTVIDSMNVGRNIVFVPEVGSPKNSDETIGAEAFSLIFLIVGQYQGVGVQTYDLRSPDLGLLGADGKWEEAAYLLRNSYAAAGMLPGNLVSGLDQHSIVGFRRITDKAIRLDGSEITLTAKTAPRYARGVIAKREKEFIVCGIGFVAEIRTKNAHFIKAERGLWNKDKYRYIGRPKPNTVKIGRDRIMIEMDDDDLSSSDVFRIDEKQYCVRVYVR